MKIINYKEINKLKVYIPFDINTNSRLYYDKDLIHKVLYNNPKRIFQNIEYVYDKNLDGLIEVNNFIEKDYQLVGYSFKRYKDYHSLNKNKNRSYELKRNDCYEIINIFNELSKNNIIYGDYHCSNVLLNKKTNDIKICDLDNIAISDRYDIKLQQLKSVAILCLMYLYNLKYIDVLILLKEGYDLNCDEIINKYFNNLANGECEDFSRVIKGLDLSIIDDKKKNINNHIEELKTSGYYLNYYL